MDTSRVVIVGLDGGTFDLLDPLIEQGILPNLSALKDQSASGTLLSTNPPTTPPAWTTCTTGLNPGRHGIFDFTVSPLADPARPIVNAQSARGRRLWHYLQQQNQRSVFINVPITYPPEPIAGAMVSGMMTPGFNSPFTWPPDLRDRLKAVCGNYIPNVDIPQYDTSRFNDALAFLKDLHECLDRRREAVRHLMEQEQWTVFMVVFVGLDRILHLFAKYLFPDTPLSHSSTAQKLRPHLLNEIQHIDTVVGEIIQNTRSNDTVMVVSDHGFGMTDGYFNANTWLLKQKLLAVKQRPYMQKRLFHIAHQIGDSRLIRTMLPDDLQSNIRHYFRKKRSTLHSARKDIENVIDWNRTHAFFSSIPCQGITINQRTAENPRGIVSTDELPRLKQTIRTGLLELKHPETREPLADNVWFREELFQGDETRFAPHILFKMKNYSILGRQHLGAATYFTSTRHLPIGFHRSNGMIMVRHPSIQPGPIQASIADVLPTVLYAAGLAIPRGLDGRLLLELFPRDYIAQHPPEYLPIDSHDETPRRAGLVNETVMEYNEDEKQELENRLRSLGYLE